MLDTEMVQALPGMLYGDHTRVTLLSRVLRQMGQPDHAFQIIHVCGTNGKGSTSAMVASILQTMGYQVGLFSSTQVMSVEESIQINQTEISSKDFNQTLQTVQWTLQEMGLAPDTDLSYFETLVLVALVYFKQQAVDYVVWECGLGGELDATNAVDRVAYTLFTKISLDHTAILGDSLTAIATTKSKIIRPKTPVIIAPNQATAAVKVLQVEGQRQQVPITMSTTDWLRLNQLTPSGQSVRLTMPNQPAITITLALAGTYQLENLATALTWYRQFCQDQNHELDGTVLKTALAQVQLPGRFERLSNQPLIVIDGAHNPDGMRQFVASVQERYADYDLTIITGFLKDKAVLDCLQLLTQLSATFILTEPQNPDQRQLPVAELVMLYEQLTHQTVISSSSIEQALTKANQQPLGQRPRVILVVGSFYLLKTVRQLVLNQGGSNAN